VNDMLSDEAPPHYDPVHHHPKSCVDCEAISLAFCTKNYVDMLGVKSVILYIFSWIIFDRYPI